MTDIDDVITDVSTQVVIYLGAIIFGTIMAVMVGWIGIAMSGDAILSGIMATVTWFVGVIWFVKTIRDMMKNK